MPIAAIESRKGEAVDTADTEQLSIVLGRGIVITFQQHPGDCFDEVRARIEAGRPRIRALGPAYLAYALLDAVVDSYFPVIEGVAERIEMIEQRLMTDHPGDTMTEIYEVRQDLAALRRLVWSQRSMLESLVRDDRFAGETAIYLRDVLDHANRQHDIIDTYRDLAAGVFDLWTSKANIRTGEITRVLTVFASIFIPITFVASVYGMNFVVLPGSESAIGFWVLMGLMFVSVIGLLWFFRRKGWLTSIPSSVESRSSRSPNREMDP
jgi:magnesium transporter